jgi:uncharacterized tellurite resistance protein B-like protein
LLHGNPSAQSQQWSAEKFAGDRKFSRVEKEQGMSLIDRVLVGQQTGKGTALSVREAATTILVASVACDGALTPEERIRLNALLSSMRLYRDVADEELQRLIDGATHAIAQYGAEELLPACALTVPEDLRAPLFALAVELVFVDGRVAEREKQFIDVLQKAFGIDEDTAMRIVGVLLIKSRA